MTLALYSLTLSRLYKLLQLVGNVSVPSNSTLNVIDKTSQYYLEENSSLGATAGTANTLCVTCSYEDIS